MLWMDFLQAIPIEGALNLQVVAETCYQPPFL